LQQSESSHVAAKSQDILLGKSPVQGASENPTVQGGAAGEKTMQQADANVAPGKLASAEPTLDKVNLPHQYMLANGLKVVLLADKAYPFISCFSWYRVGSRDDPAGMTGLTHLVEHLLFQNIGSFGGNQLANTIVCSGGEFSGFTSEDFTAFYSNLPVNRLELAIRGEAERMRGGHFTKADVEREINHLLKGAANESQDLSGTLIKEVHALAYEHHPYRNPPGGWPHELEHLTYEEARSQYDRYFHPNNACLVLAGDFEEWRAMSLIEKYFAALPKAATLPGGIYTQERPQLAERQIKLKARSGKESIMIAYKVPGISDADAPAIAVLEQLFNGQMHGRLRSKLIEPGLCSAAQASFELKRYPGLFIVNCSGIPANGSAKVLQVLDANLAQLKSKPLTEAEVSQAVKLAEFIYYSDGSGPYKAGFQIGLFETLANGQEAYAWPERIRQLTAADILRVARRYLNEENRVLGQITVLASGQSGENNSKPIATVDKDHPSKVDQERRTTTAEHFRLAAYQSGEARAQPAVFENPAPAKSGELPKVNDHTRVPAQISNREYSL
jgi:zinc protease